MNKKQETCYAYVDGSYNPETGIYGGGGIIVDHKGNRHIVFSSRKNKEVSKMRNVAGEILGCLVVLEKAYLLKMGKIKIYYDYEGLENWVTGKWKPKKPETRRYKSRVKSYADHGLDISFEHVKGHSGILENEEVDQLAKKVVGIKNDFKRI